MATDVTEKFQELIADFNTGMLVTQTSEGQLRARPMVIAGRYKDGTLVFVSDDKGGKIDEIVNHPQVNLSLQGEDKFLSISGKVTISYDREMIAKLWQTPWKVWFPQGKDDPGLKLVTLHPETGEYWDISGVNELRFLFEAGKAMLQGEKIQDADGSLHAKVNLEK